MRLFVLIHDDIWAGDETTPGVSGSLIVDTGEMIVTIWRDWLVEMRQRNIYPIFYSDEVDEAGNPIPLVDENGKPLRDYEAAPTVENYEYSGWGPPYTVEGNERVGGFQHVGHVGHIANWGAYVLQSSKQRLETIDSRAPAAKWVPLTLLDEDDTIKQGQLNDTIMESARTTLNVKLAARGLPLIPSGWSNKQMLKRVFEEFEGEFAKDGVLERLI